MSGNSLKVSNFQLLFAVLLCPSSHVPTQVNTLLEVIGSHMHMFIPQLLRLWQTIYTETAISLQKWVMARTCGDIIRASRAVNTFSQRPCKRGNARRKGRTEGRGHNSGLEVCYEHFPLSTCQTILTYKVPLNAVSVCVRWILTRAENRVYVTMTGLKFKRLIGKECIEWVEG